MNYKLAKQLKDAGFPKNVSIGSLVYDLKGKTRYAIWEINPPQLITLVPESVSIEETKDNLSRGFKKTESSSGKDYILSPSLSELIEACGDELDCLENLGARDKRIKIKKWGAWNGCTNEKSIQIEERTPEEAVAKLWLKLQQ